MAKFTKQFNKELDKQTKGVSGSQYLLGASTSVGKQTFIPSMSNNFEENIVEGLEKLQGTKPKLMKAGGNKHLSAPKTKANKMVTPATHTQNNVSMVGDNVKVKTPRSGVGRIFRRGTHGRFA
jgi:hypothetical protein